MSDTAPRLTPAQAEFLRAVIAGRAYRSEGHRDLYKTYRIGDRRPVRESTITALMAARLIAHSYDRHPDVRGVTTMWVATDSGRNHPAAKEN